MMPFLRVSHPHWLNHPTTPAASEPPTAGRLPQHPVPHSLCWSWAHLIAVERPLCASNSFASPRAHIDHPLFALGVLRAVDRLPTHRTKERSPTACLLRTPPLRVVISTTALGIIAAMRQQRRARHACACGLLAAVCTRGSEGFTAFFFFFPRLCVFGNAGVPNLKNR